MTSILLVDDHVLVREGLRLLLQDAGYEVLGEAGDGREALQFISQNDPDIVLMDITLPLINGIDVLRLLSEQGRRSRVILLTMHQSAQYLREALRFGVWGYVLKGERSSVLFEAIATVGAGRRYYSAKLSDLLHEVMNQGAEAPDPVTRLTARESQVLKLVLDGKTSAEIAALLYLSVKTVETYRSRLMKRLGVRDLVGLIKFMMRRETTASSAAEEA